MAVSQAFIFHFEWYSLLHFAVCQLLCWDLLLIVLISCKLIIFFKFLATPKKYYVYETCNMHTFKQTQKEILAIAI